MLKIHAIMINTFREAIRDRILYNLLIFALLIIGGSILLGTLTIGEQQKIIKDMGLASISIFGTLIAVFVGIGLVYKEIERKTIYNIISKPVHRYQFFIGKYLGLILTLLVNVLIMTGGFLSIIYFMDGSIQFGLVKAIFLIFMELAMITAIALFFSTFTTPTLSATFTLAIYVIGHLSQDLKVFGAKSELPWVRRLTGFLYYVLPNLQNFNIKGLVVHNLPLPANFILLSFLYSLLYTGILLMLAICIFGQRDFK
jgi:ABC-type transport system involved in multi-copper enzyme maturation permease subunit